MRTGVVIPAVLAAAAFYAAGESCLRHGHPFEDAYILFKYVRMHGDGHGWAFWPGGPQTLGFVDGLWALVLAAIHTTGLDPARAAVAANAAVLATLVAWITHRAPEPARPAVAVGGAVWLLLSPAAAASLGGFGTLPAALALSLLCHARNPGMLPAIGLLATTVRPEMVVPALCTAIVRRRGRTFWVAALCTGAVAAALLVWRLHTFGLLVPLPVTVKGGEAALLPGLAADLRWLRRLHGPLPILVAIAVLSRHSKDTGRPLLIAASLLVPLAFTTQLQNVLWRFQAPIVVASASVLADTASRHPRPRLALVLSILAMTPSAIVGGKRAIELVRGGPNRSTEAVAAHYAEHLQPEDTLLLTEAGMLAYFTRARTVDAIGLNTTEFAFSPLGSTTDPNARIARLQPSAISLHTYGCVDPNRLPREPTLDDLRAALLPTTPSSPVTTRTSWYLLRYLATRPPGSWHLHVQKLGRRLLLHAVRGDRQPPTLEDSPQQTTYDALRQRATHAR